MKLAKKLKLLPFSLPVLLLCPEFLLADYTIVLKNGGRITVKNYWEDKGMVRFHGLDGEIGLAREQIQSIRKSGEIEAQGLVVSALRAKVPVTGTLGLASDEPPDQTEKLLRANKEKLYHDMYDSVARSIKSRMELHWAITRGKTDPGPTLLENLEALNGRINDLNSRIKDATLFPARRTGQVRLLTNSPFTGFNATIDLGPSGPVSHGFVDARTVNPSSVDPAVRYSAAEWELSALRRELESLYEERKRLVETLEAEGVFTGAQPYEAFP